MTQNTSDKTKLTIKYLEKFRSGETLSEDESLKLDHLLSELKANGREDLTSAKRIMKSVVKMYKWRDVLYAIWAFFVN